MVALSEYGRMETRNGASGFCERVDVDPSESLFACTGIFDGAGASQDEVAAVSCALEDDIDILHVADVCMFKCAESAGDLLAQGRVAGIGCQAGERPVDIQL